MERIRYPNHPTPPLGMAGRVNYKSSGMANTTLTVIVSRGKPPAPIIVRCFKDGKHFLDLSSPGSFSHHFTELLEGDYEIFITGFNDVSGGNTSCYLSEEEIKIKPPLLKPVICEEPYYLLRFRFSVGDDSFK